MTDRVTQAAEAVVRRYEETQRLLPLAGGVPQPIEESGDPAVVLAVAHLAAKRAEPADTRALRAIADFMDAFGFGRGDTGDAPHVRAAADDIDRLRQLLQQARAGNDLYARGYDLIGACDISNYLALCQLAGQIGEPVLHDLALRMDAEREYREKSKC